MYKYCCGHRSLDKRTTTKFIIGFIYYYLVYNSRYIFRGKYMNPFLTFLTYHFLHASLIHPSRLEILWKCRDKHSEMPVFPRLAEFRAWNTGTESFYLTFDSAGAGRGRWTHVRMRNKIKKKKMKKRKKRERRRKEKRVNAGVDGACASTHRRVSLTAWRRDARRRQ